MDPWTFTCVLCILGSVLTSKITGGELMCVCTTYECLEAGRAYCKASGYCYSQEQVQDNVSVFEKGCIDGRTPLLCENKAPHMPVDQKGSLWPMMSCCRNEDYCNANLEPAKPVGPVPGTRVPPVNKYNSELEEKPLKPQNDDSETEKPCRNNSDSSRLNPIYIAVPVAGVCVLLALIIFAMYLLRRRTDYYGNYDNYQYHEQISKLAKKQTEPSTTSCNGGLNRCTDSERSSQGSETKLFLNA